MTATRGLEPNKRAPPSAMAAPEPTAAGELRAALAADAPAGALSAVLAAHAPDSAAYDALTPAEVVAVLRRACDDGELAAWLGRAGDAWLARFREAAPQAEEAARGALAAGDAAPSSALLLPVHSLPAFACASIPALPDDQLVFRGAVTRGSGTFVDAEQFAHSWRVFTMDQLAGLDWSGLIAAGGSVLACATTSMPSALGSRAREATRQQLCRARLAGVDPALTSSPAFAELHGRGAPGNLAVADIDLWLCGLTPEEASAKVAHIGAVLTANAAKRGATVMVARTVHTFTFFSAYPFRCVQVVNALFPSAAAPLLDFDLDCCAMAFDGTRVLALPRALAAAAARANVMRAGLEPRGGRSFTRALKYSERGFALALPRDALAPLDAQRADELFSFGKLAMLSRKAAVSSGQLARWRAMPSANLYPPQPTSQPPQTWVTGVMTSESVMASELAITPVDPRGFTYSAGIVQEDGSDDELEDPDTRDILAQCNLVALLYPARRGRHHLALPDFPHTLPRPTDYGEGAPDIAYGPPLASDSGRSPLPALDLSDPAAEGARFFGEALPLPLPRRSPVDADETSQMLQARAGPRVRVMNVGSMRSGPGAFKAAAFADAPPTGGQHVRVAYDTVTLPELSLAAARSAPQVATADAFGAAWRLSATTRGGWLVIRLELASAPPPSLLALPPPPLPGAGSSEGEAIDPDAPQRLLPVNILVEAGTRLPSLGVRLDSHAVFGSEEGLPRSWSHVIYWDKLRGDGKARGGGAALRVTLQAVRVAS